MAPPQSSPLKNKNLFNNLLIALAGFLVYFNSLRVPFIFDDNTHILSNPRIQNLWPIWEILRHTNRPVIDLSLALNYSLGQNNPFGYHVFNLLIHVGAALVLYALLRRTFQTRRTPQPIQSQAQNLAFDTRNPAIDELDLPERGMNVRAHGFLEGSLHQIVDAHRGHSISHAHTSQCLHFDTP